METETTAAEAASRMADDLTALGVRRGGVLLVHASLRSLGSLPGAAETAVQALLAVLGPYGTLLMPALSYETVGAGNPVFDVAHTPSCVGALPDYFRTRPGVRRSVHPTHSACGTGSAAEGLLANHHLDTTPCGPHSPFRRLPQANGQLLFLGCGMRPNTSMHAMEEVVVPPYLFADVVEYRVTLADGGTQARGVESQDRGDRPVASTGAPRAIIMRVRAHDFRGWVQRYDRLEGLLRRPALRVGTVLGATAHLVEAGAMWQAAVAALRRDPLCFVERSAAD